MEWDTFGNYNIFGTLKRYLCSPSWLLLLDIPPKSHSQDEYCDHSFAIFQLLQEAILVLLIRPEFHYVFSFIFKFGKPCEV